MKDNNLINSNIEVSSCIKFDEFKKSVIIKNNKNTELELKKTDLFFIYNLLKIKELKFNEDQERVISTFSVEITNLINSDYSVSLEYIKGRMNKIIKMVNDLI